MGNPLVAMASTPLPPRPGPPVFVSYSERREHVNSRGGRKSGGHVYCIKFFLIDSTGAEHLAAVGEDQGDAHYLYSNLPGFPGLFGHNKADVKRWLEEVQSRSQARAGYHLDVVTDPVPPEGSGPVALPSCVAYRQARRETPDGRHVVQWYLVDAVGGEHLAVAGEEKDTRDGHYEYRTQGIFESAAPLLAHNQTTVLKWLDSMVVHPAGASAGGAGSVAGASWGPGAGAWGPGSLGTPGAAWTPGARPAPRSSGRRSAGAAGAGRKRGGDLVRQATTKKWRNQYGAGGGGGLAAKALDPAGEARDVLAHELRRWAGEESAARRAARAAALAFATDACEAEAEAAAARVAAWAGDEKPDDWCVGFGEEGVDASSDAALSSSREPFLDDLRLLSSARATLALLLRPGLHAALARARDGARGAIAQACGALLAQWAGQLAAHSAVLTHPRYVRDPQASLEGALARPGWLAAARAAVAGAARLPGEEEEEEGRAERGGFERGGWASASPGGSPRASALPSPRSQSPGNSALEQSTPASSEMGGRSAAAAAPGEVVSDLGAPPALVPLAADALGPLAPSMDDVLLHARSAKAGEDESLVLMLSDPLSDGGELLEGDEP